ncbi:MAG: signal peptidase [Frankiales bacterium]|nr:signal peptidase [Frankiales bacterium]
MSEDPGADAPPAAPVNTSTAVDDEAAATPGTPDKPHGSFLRELPVLIAIALVLALLLKAFLIQAFYIPSGSMEQTLQVGDRVLVNKLVYRTRDVRRGEVVVFNGLDSFTPEFQAPPPGNAVQKAARWLSGLIGFGRLGEKDFIKRVIGVPGDTVQCCDPQGRVTVNGVALDEPYLYQDDHAPFGPVKVPKGRLWVMGDHRSQSSDSRAHLGSPGGGTVPENKVIGRAFVVVWPTDHAGKLSIPQTFKQKTLQGMALPGAPYLAGALLVAPFALLRRRRRTRLP